jgi:hypothetical protein
MQYALLMIKHVTENKELMKMLWQERERYVTGNITKRQLRNLTQLNDETSNGRSL